MVSERVAHANSKNEDTWYGKLTHYDAEYCTAPRVFEGQWQRWLIVQCYAIFNRNDGKRRVNVNRNDNRWNRNYRFAGVRKSLISPRLRFGSFVLKFDYANLQAFFRFHLGMKKFQYIFCL